MGYRRDAFRRGLAWMLRIVGGADREGGADKSASLEAGAGQVCGSAIRPMPCGSGGPSIVRGGAP